MRSRYSYSIAILALLSFFFMFLSSSVLAQEGTNTTGTAISLSSAESTAAAGINRGIMEASRNPGFLIPLLFITGLVVFIVTMNIKEG